MDELDVEALLEASFTKQSELKKSVSPEYDKKKKSKKKKRSVSRERSYKDSHSSRDHKSDKEHLKDYRNNREHTKDYRNDREHSKDYKNDKDHSHSRDYRGSPRRQNSLDSENHKHRRMRSRSRSRSPYERPRYPRNFYGPRRNFYRNSGGYHRDYQRRSNYDNYRRSRSRSRSRERRSSKKEKRSPTPKQEEKVHEEADKPARLHKNPDLTPEERDMRTVFCMQLSQHVRARDLEEFFSPVGKVQDVRIILDNKTRRSKGIAYVEFQDTFSVSLAMGLSGKKLHGIPIVVQLTQAEKNRAAAALAASTMNVQRGNVGPMQLYVGSLHYNVTEEMLKGIFEPFGKIDKIELIKDNETGRSKGYGFVTFHDAENAKKALEQLNGLELAGKPMKVNIVTSRSDLTLGPAYLDTEEMDRAGIDLGATGRLQLMAKLAEGTGFELPQAAVKALQLSAQATASPMTGSPSVSVATQCFMLSNMFDPAKESGPNWDEEIKNDVIEECRNHGGVLHVHVDKNSPEGNVYVKCPNLTSAAASVRSLHGRYFAGRVIVAAYVPVVNYHMLFPESATATSVL